MCAVVTILVNFRELENIYIGCEVLGICLEICNQFEPVLIYINKN